MKPPWSTPVDFLLSLVYTGRLVLSRGLSKNLFGLNEKCGLLGSLGNKERAGVFPALVVIGLGGALLLHGRHAIGPFYFGHGVVCFNAINVSVLTIE